MPYPALENSISHNIAAFDRISAERRSKLAEAADFITAKLGVSLPAWLVFICTHNSRRSHMAQLWAQAAALHHGFTDVTAFSGGTEASAFDPRAVAALKRAGFAIAKSDDSGNPVYRIEFHDDAPPLLAFSKVHDQPPNPRAGFCAVMTCAQADRACPVVPGAEERIAIPYDDPKAFDGTELEIPKYDERCRQIGREMLYLFSLVRK